MNRAWNTSVTPGHRRAPGADVLGRAAMSGTYKTGAVRPGTLGEHAHSTPRSPSCCGTTSQTGSALNVTAFLVSGIAAAIPELVGEPYADADGTAYLPMFGQPVMVFAGDAAVLTRRPRARPPARAARSRCSPPTCSRRATTTTTGPRWQAVRDDLDLVGIAVHGPRNAVDKIVKGARMHP